MVSHDEQSRRFEASKRAAKAAVEEETKRRQQTTEKLRSLRLSKRANGAGSTKPEKLKLER